MEMRGKKPERRPPPVAGLEEARRPEEAGSGGGLQQRSDRRRTGAWGSAALALGEQDDLYRILYGDNSLDRGHYRYNAKNSAARKEM